MLMPISMETSAWGAMIAAAEGAVMLVVLVLPLAEEGIGGVEKEADAV